MAVDSKQPLLKVVVTVLFAAAAAAQPVSLPNCPTKCGSVTIPFPFGTTEDCSLDSTFLIDCNQTFPHTPLLPRSNHRVLSISSNGELRVAWPVASYCYNRTDYLVNGTTQHLNYLTNRTTQHLNLTNFHLSSSRNKLTAIGCDTTGAVRVTDSEGKDYATGCVSLCFSLEDNNIGASGSCSGIGCCEISIPQGHGLWRVIYISGGTGLGGGPDLSPCGYSFLVENGAYSFASTDHLKLEQTEFPVVLDWAVGNQTCQQAQKQVSTYACKANNSECHNAIDRPGYLCKCSHGFGGNPYLPAGCQDIDECKESSHDCVDGAKCINIPGSYNCKCRRGYDGDGKKNGTKCSPKSRTQIILMIALGVSVCMTTLLMGSFYVYWRLKRKKLIKLREQFFLQNGGLLLQRQIARQRGSTETTKIFTVEELKEATNNFDEDKILGQGGHGTVYKGVLQDNRIVAIKKSKISDPNQIEQFINEVIVLSQINHRNVVKLLGCCLETEVPLLVYEFIPNGTVSEHLHDQSQSLKLTWKTRLRIAVETAGALAYLHSAASTPIIHRDVKNTNILLDCNLTAKVSDFGASRIVPLDRNQLTTLVQGTLGYLDPEYFHTSQLTEKSDVYSFGVVLAELLTRKKAISFDRPEDDRNLAVYFVSSMKEDRLLHIVDSHIIDEANVEQIMKVANITERSLRVKREERPTMKEVAMELEGILVMEKKQWGSGKLCSEETESLLKASSSVFNAEDGISGSGIGSSGFDSMNRISMSLSGGR